jgi:hypothetical protein
MLHKHQIIPLPFVWHGIPAIFEYWYEACPYGYRGGLIQEEEDVENPLDELDGVYEASNLGELEQHLTSLIVDAMKQ